MKTHEWPMTERRYILCGMAACYRTLLEFYRTDGQRDVNLDDIIVGQHHLGSSGGHFPAWDPESRRNTLLLRFAQLMGQHTGPSYERATPSEIIHINIENVPGEGSLLPLMC